MAKEPPDFDEAVYERLLHARTDIVSRFPFFGYLLLALDLHQDSNSVQTLQTDGVRLRYNPEYLAGLNDGQLNTALVHEVLHCALEHPWRAEERDKQTWNYAVDYVVNLMLLEEVNKEKTRASKDSAKPLLDEPPDWLLDVKYRGMTAEEVYEVLKKDDEEKAERTPCWADACGNEEGDGSSGTAEESGGDSQGGSNLARDWRERLYDAAEYAGRGSVPGQMANILEQMHEGQLSWRDILRRLILRAALARSNFRLYPANRRHLWRGMYLPSIYGDVLELAIGVDVSGSISDKEFRDFMAELKGITRQFPEYILHIFFCDAAIQEYKCIKTFDVWPDKFGRTSGGTEFTPVFTEIDNRRLNVMALVYLTDGDGTYPEVAPSYPVIWVLSRQYEKIPWGEKVMMDRLAPRITRY